MSFLIPFFIGSLYQNNLVIHYAINSIALFVLFKIRLEKFAGAPHLAYVAFVPGLNLSLAYYLLFYKQGPQLDAQTTEKLKRQFQKTFLITLALAGLALVPNIFLLAGDYRNSPSTQNFLNLYYISFILIGFVNLGNLLTPASKAKIRLLYFTLAFFWFPTLAMILGSFLQSGIKSIK